MIKRFRLKFFAVVVLVLATLSVIGQQRTRPPGRPAAQTDIKIKYRNTFSGQTNESSTMIKGDRERTEMNMGYGGNLVTIMQCDLKRSIQVSDQTRKYVITPMQTETASDSRQPLPAPAPAGATRRGGVVTYTSTATDTGERKEMFGFTARHIKTTLDIESTPDACNPVKQRMETDGWYIDLSVGLDCDWGRAQVMARPAIPGGCKDQTRFRRQGVARTGYPLSETTTMYGPNGAVTFTATKEVVELSREPLDAALFDIPAGYTEVQNTQELYGAPSMSSMPSMSNETPTSQPAETSDSSEGKKSGQLRIGVMPLDNKTDRSLSTENLRERLISELAGMGVDAIPLNAQTQFAADVEAKAKQCDFYLSTEIGALKSSKLGGMFGKITGQPGGKSDARLDFKLYAVGESAPRLQSSASGKGDGEEASAGVAVTSEARTVTAEVKKRGRN